MNAQEIITKYHCDKSAKRRLMQHQDVIKLDAKHGKGKMKKTDSGFLEGIAPVAKVGIMSYLLNDGSILKEFVPAETLFDQESMDSFKLKPVTNNHPAEKKINSDNAWRNIGSTGENISQDGDFLMAPFVITDGFVVNKVNDGKQELSPGYEVELVFQDGEYNGIKYDAIQVSRKYNHLAVVDGARGGADIRMQLDGVSDYGFEKQKNDSKPKLSNKEKKMPKFVIDNIDYEASQEVINHISKLDASIVTLDTEAVKVKTNIDTITAERDTLKTKVENLEKVDNNDAIQKAVTERLNLERIAGIVLDNLDGVEKLDVRDLKLKIIEKKFPKLVKEKIDSKTSEAYINAVLDSIKESFTKEQNDSLSSQRKETSSKQDAENTNEGDDLDSNSDKAQKKMNQDQQNAWKLEKETENK